MKNEFYSLGIDVGSTTVKIVILDFQNMKGIIQK